MQFEDFLSNGFVSNAYIEDLPEWNSLYVRKGNICIVLDIEGQKKFYQVSRVFTFANIEAAVTGIGTYTALVNRLIADDWAIYVECVHNARFAESLRKREYMEIKCEGVPSFLFNFRDHLTLMED